MKKLYFILFTLTALVICSCSNKVDLYSDKGDSTVVYAMLDASVDTNFIKITKSFVGDATTLAHDYSACNYDYKLDVKLIRKKDTLVLDTVSRWIPYDESSTFYSGCYQTYYYTTAQLVEGETYKLVINRNDGVVVSSEAETIDKFQFSSPNEGQEINFASATAKNNVKWVNKGNSGNYKSNASMFEVIAYFRYEELQPGAAEWVDKEIRWKMGSGTADDLYVPKYAYYSVSYLPSNLFSIIENNDYLKNNSPYGVQRKIKKIRIEITGIGSELYNYLIINNSSSAIMDTPEYTNIENGIGLMSSRVTKTRMIIPGDLTRQKITNDYPSFGFIYDPNDPVD